MARWRPTVARQGLPVLEGGQVGDDGRQLPVDAHEVRKDLAQGCEALQHRVAAADDLELAAGATEAVEDGRETRDG